MKRFFLALIITIMSVGCNSDENTNTNPITIKSKIHGIWRLDSKEKDGQNIILNDCEKKGIFQLYDNNSFDMVFYYFTGECLEESLMQGSTYRLYTFENNILTIRYDDIEEGLQVHSGEIIKLDDENLEWKVDFDYPNNPNNEILKFKKINN